MHARARRALQDTLTAIRLKTPLSACGYALHPNGERHLRSRARLATLYPPEMLDATVALAERCAFSLDELRYEYPEEIVPPGETPASHLRKLTEEGLARRYGSAASSPARPSPRVRGEGGAGEDARADRARARADRGAALRALLPHRPRHRRVRALARHPVPGPRLGGELGGLLRLGITEVDPARCSMLFERFISKERNEPPDIDVDFEHERREEVIQYVYAKYGRDRAALAATLISYRPKSAVRDVGRALGLDLAQVDRLTRHVRVVGRQGGVRPSASARPASIPAIRSSRRLIALASELIGFPRHLSQHVGGFVIARGLLERMVPVENAAMPDRTVIQWDKDDLDALGLLKVDCLALGMLTAIRRCLDLVSRWRGHELRVQDIPPRIPPSTR